MSGSRGVDQAAHHVGVRSILLDADRDGRSERGSLVLIPPDEPAQCRADLRAEQVRANAGAATVVGAGRGGHLGRDRPVEPGMTLGYLGDQAGVGVLSNHILT